MFLSLQPGNKKYIITHVIVNAKGTSISYVGCLLQALVHNAEKHGILKGEEKVLGWGATKLLIALALLPEEIIEEGFEIISEVIFKDCKKLKSFFNYYQDTWIKGFKPGAFCVFQQSEKTNNASERHNRELRQDLHKHSTIVEFLGIM